MSQDSITTEAKARLFDQLVLQEALVVEALVSLAHVKAHALIAAHKSGLRAGGRGFNQADFGLDGLSSAHEALTGAPMPVDQIVQRSREQLERSLTAATFAGAEQ